MKVSAVTIRRGLNQIKQLLDSIPNRIRGHQAPLRAQPIYHPMSYRQGGMTMVNPLGDPAPICSAPQRSLPPLPQALPSIQPLVNGFYANGNNDAPVKDFYANGTTTDAQINGGMEDLQAEESAPKTDVTGPLAVAADLKLYEDFMALDNIGYEGNDGNDSSLKGLCDPMYRVERNTSHHKSGFLLHLLMWYYRQNFLSKPDNTVTFTTFITTISEADISKVWRMPDPGGTQEYIRRFKQGVRYLTPEKQENYNVLSKQGKLHWAKWNAPLDTTIPYFFKRKHEQYGTFEKDQIAIWVMSKENKLYTHAAKIHRFHHSSFTRGDVIRCAGDWEVKDGKLMWLSAASGHYRPSFENLSNAIQILGKDYGLNANHFGVKLFRRIDSKTVVPEFVSGFKFVQDLNSFKQKLLLSP